MGDRGGGGGVLEGSLPLLFIPASTRQPDTESHPPAPQQPIHSSPRGAQYQSGPCRPASYPFEKEGEISKSSPPPSAPPPQSGHFAARLTPGRRLECPRRRKQKQAGFFSFDVRSRLLLLLLPPTCCQSKHTPQCPANITPSVEQAAPLSLICLKWLWWEGKWPENEGNVGLGQMRWPNVGQKCAAQDLRLLLCPLVGKAFQFYSRCKKSEGIFYVVCTTPATIFCQLSSISLIDLVSVMANEDYAKHERGFEKKKVFFPPLTTMWKKMY